jgi:synaptic vesicle membrane protein VAT-1
MQRVVIHKPGGTERLGLEEHGLPHVPRDHVHVAVTGIGVNYADCLVRMGLYRSAREYVGWPITPGFEVSGHVARVGEGITDLEVGQPVVAVTRFGAYGTDLVVPRRQVFAPPERWSLVEAAGFLVTHLTAYYAMVELANPRPGANVLVHSAAGGVGGALVRIARRLDARVVGVVGSPHKVSVAEAAGCDVVIDRSSQSLWSRAEHHAPAGYDVVLDAHGVGTLRQSYAHLAPTGRLVIYGFHGMIPRPGQRLRWLRLLWHWLLTPRFDPLDLTTRNRSVMGFNLSYLFDHAVLLQRAVETLRMWAADGTLPPPPTQTYPLARVADAHRDLESGQTVGKLVLVPTRSDGRR